MPPAIEAPTDAQLDVIRAMCRERSVPLPDVDGPPLPDPKARSLVRGERKYRRRVASAKQWQKIAAEKIGPCRVHVAPSSNGHDFGKIHFHHVVSRAHGGDDVADNIVPVCAWCYNRLHTLREASAAIDLLASLSDAEYAYMIQRGGEGYPERAYGVRYER